MHTHPYKSILAGITLSLGAMILTLAGCASRPVPPSATTAPPAEIPAGGEASLAGTVLGIVVDSSNVVLYIEPQSAAEICGIQPGDTLESINDKPLKGPNNDRNETRGSYGNDKDRKEKVKVKYRQGGKLINCDATPRLMYAPPNGPITPVPVDQFYY